ALPGAPAALRAPRTRGPRPEALAAPAASSLPGAHALRSHRVARRAPRGPAEDRRRARRAGRAARPGRGALARRAAGRDGGARRARSPGAGAGPVAPPWPAADRPHAVARTRALRGVAGLGDPESGLRDRARTHWGRAGGEQPQVVQLRASL